MHDLRVAPSILAADFTHLADEVADVAPAVPMLHVDVMDGHYVPNISLGPPVIASLRAVTTLVLDCHLMITDPARYAPQLVELGVESVTFHPEVEDDPRALIDHLHDIGAEVGVALNPSHPLTDVHELLAHVDLLLIMTVEPGFGGQSFIPAAVPKVTEAVEWRARHAAGFRIQVDGGISNETIEAPARAGADTFVAGSAVFRAPDHAAAARDLLSRATSARLDRPAVGHSTVSSGNSS